MREYVWGELSGEKVQYSDQTWEMTGDVEVRRDGELLAVAVVAADDVRHGAAMIDFSLGELSPSPNPGQLDRHFVRIERTKSNVYLVMSDGVRTYRYRATRIET